MTSDHPPPVEPAAGADMQPAFLLAAEVPCVPGWVDAHTALTLLRAELAAGGLAGVLPHAHAEVTATGTGVVELGRILPHTARRLAALLAQARAAHRSDPAEDTGPGPGLAAVVPRPREAA